MTSRNGDKMYYLKRFQTFPPIEAGHILAEAIKLKRAHIQKFDKIEPKCSSEELVIKDIPKPKSETNIPVESIKSMSTDMVKASSPIKYNPLETINQKPLEKESAMKLLNACIINLKAEEYS